MCQLYLFQGNVTPDTGKWKDGSDLWTLWLRVKSHALLKEFISNMDKKLTQVSVCRLRKMSNDFALNSSLFQTDYECKSLNSNTMHCMHLTLNRMKALGLSSASSHLQAFCLSHQWVWLSCWSSETELMKLHFYSLTVKSLHQPSIQLPALFSCSRKPNLIGSWINHKQSTPWNWVEAVWHKNYIVWCSI